MAKLKAVLFDLDDTLIDWSQFDGNYYSLELPHLTKVRDYVIGEGYDLPHIDRIIDQFRDRAQSQWQKGRESMVAPHLPKILMEVLAHFDVPVDKLDVDAVIDIYGWGKIPSVTVFKEVPETLELLLEAGLQIGIVTNAFQTMRMRDVELDEHGLLTYFKTCRFAAADVGYLKPHPAIFEAALQCTGTTVEETVFVGDNLNADIAGAQGVGMKAIWRDTGYHASRMARDMIKPDGTIKKLDQLLPYLDEWYPGWR